MTISKIKKPNAASSHLLKKKALLPEQFNEPGGNSDMQEKGKARWEFPDLSLNFRDPQHPK